MAVAEQIDAELVRRLHWEPTEEGRQSLSLTEWLVTNGPGGYAAGTVPAAPPRRSPGLLIAALPRPFGRRMMFNRVWETVRRADGRVVSVQQINETSDGTEISTARYLTGFQLESGLPVWTYDVDG